MGFTKGQVLGGRWKPLQYYFMNHLYTDLFVVGGEDGRCLVKNDSPRTSFFVCFLRLGSADHISVL